MVYMLSEQTYLWCFHEIRMCFSISDYLYMYCIVFGTIELVNTCVV